MESKERYKKWHYTSLLILGGSIALNFLLAALLGVLFFVEKPPRLVAVTNDLRVMELPNLEQQHLTDAVLCQFVADTVPEILSLDFDKYMRTLHRAQDKFSPSGNTQFLKILVEKGWLDLVRSRRLLIHCAISSPPTIANRWIQNGAMTWDIQAPIIVSVESSEGKIKENRWTLRVVLERCSLRENARGVWITLIQVV